MVRFFASIGEVFAYTVLGITVFVALFLLRIGQVELPILMYRGIVFALIAAIVQALIIARLVRKVSYGRYIVLSATSLAFAANVIFLVVFPVTIDRSVTVYLLGQIAAHPNGMTEDELNERLIRQYVKEYRGVDRRMQEQILTGNVTIAGDRYLLTSQGENFIQLGRIISDIFGVDPRYVRAEKQSRSEPSP